MPTGRVFVLFLRRVHHSCRMVRITNRTIPLTAKGLASTISSSCLGCTKLECWFHAKPHLISKLERECTLQRPSVTAIAHVLHPPELDL